ncbi:uncharacterized protein [Physcomitrium patens]|uniref:Sperm-associated antigen 6 n=1 Tax=Physcomitrium patens TaxID=3218 RepID=A0A2K1KIX1_PHYPA|nr:sperm-associated antigen 6-like isoform X3 [Physcomitrium patens]PNR53719.1 hypothetical protein PHYPA_007394 [Physcomitrium patens]|eukprot:XP_024374858.1 sperm-associated antigen 6-like isoform X3 [Physcomitrella patens]
MATTRAILQHFETWEKARYVFLQSLAELFSKPLMQNVDILINAGAMELIRPLLLDNVRKIQQLACENLSKLAAWDDRLAECMITEGILVQLTHSLREAHRLSRKATTNVLRAMSKHSAFLAQSIVDQGGVELLIPVLLEFDPSVKEIAAGTLGNIAHHSPALAQIAADRGAVESMAGLINDEDLPLRRQLCASLAQIAKHTPELGTKVVESGVLSHVSAFLDVDQPDTRLKAEAVLDTKIFPNVILLLKNIEQMVRRNAAMVICEVCKHTKDQARFVLSAGCAPALVDNISDVRSHERLPGIMALGHLASFSPELSTAVISSNALPPLVDVLEHEDEDHVKGASAWSLGQIGKHTPVHAKEVALVGTMLHLVVCAKTKRTSEDLRKKCEFSIKSIVNRLEYTPALDSLLNGPIMPEQCLKLVLIQIAKLVPTSVELQTKLLLSGSFARLQELQLGAAETIVELIEKIASVYPEEIRSFYNKSNYRVFECKPNPIYTLRDPIHNIFQSTSHKFLIPER